MANPNLFEQLQEMRRTTIPVILQPGVRQMMLNARTGEMESRTAPMVGSAPIQFNIQSVSANEVIDADALVTAEPPKIFQEEASPSRIGTVQVLKGYDLDAPSYIAERQKQIPRRNAALCLYGCPALAETTPGETATEKIKNLLTGIPAMLLDWLANEIETISVLTAVGEAEVTSFLASVSVNTDTKSSPATKNPRRAGGKGKH